MTEMPKPAMPNSQRPMSNANTTTVSAQPEHLTIRDVEGSYTIPAIRSDRDGYRGDGAGTVIAALGDSITEGYWGERFWRDSLDLTADMFPPESVSRDGRNFPQYAPTAKHHAPTVNCFTSWMPRLNDLLSEQWRRPVFIANEGWGGITTGGYLDMMRRDVGWQDRMRLLKPSVWLIHLGVNDERAKVPADAFSANMRAIVDILRADYLADTSQIYLAYPSYDYAPGAEDFLRSYLVEIDRMVAGLGVRKGPDFFEAFSKDRAQWYGEDPVHPGPEGVERMAELWANTLATLPPQRERKNQ